MHFSLTDVAKGFVDVIARELQKPIAKAATAAMKDAGDVAKRTGRSSIASAGFSRKWQNALRVNIYPAQGDSMRPAAFIFHKIRYAGVFEEGAVIRGQPLLWLPLGNVPVRRGRPMTPVAVRPLGRTAGFGSTAWLAASSVCEVPRQAQPPPRGRQPQSQAALYRDLHRDDREALRHQGRGSASRGAAARPLRQTPAN